MNFDEAYCVGHEGANPGEYVMMAVSDNGKGMDQRTRDKIFEPFFTTKELGKGTGLGLSTVYGIVKQNNGAIYVYSEPEYGSTFKIYLPRHTVKTEPFCEESPLASALSGHETILLVEDEDAVLEMVKQMLEKYGFKVLASSSPRQAIRMANEYAAEIDLLITGLVMPEMTGRELVNHLVRRHPGLKYLFMSGYTSNVIAHQSVLEKGVNFLQKPFSIQQLTAKVRDVLGSK
jgi:two-component system, cell cycle sensor histidine kinase and response regulator CckA